MNWGKPRPIQDGPTVLDKNQVQPEFKSSVVAFTNTYSCPVQLKGVFKYL